MVTRPTNVFDPLYYAQLQVWDAQDRAAKDNASVRLNWPAVVNNWLKKAIGDQSAGRPVDLAPMPPLMVVVSDEGITSRVPFPDLFAPELPKLTPVPNTGGFTFGGAPGSAVAPDRTDQILAMLRAIAAKMGITGAVLLLMVASSWGQTVNPTNDPPPAAELKLFFYDGSSNLQYICWARQNQMVSTSVSVAASTLTSIVVANTADPKVGTVTHPSHGLYVGARVTVTGGTDTDLNTTYTIATVTNTNVYTISTTNVTAATYTTGLAISTVNPLTSAAKWAIQVLTYATTTLTGSFWANASVGYGLSCDSRTSY